MANSTLRSPPAATCKSTRSAAIACSFSRFHKSRGFARSHGRSVNGAAVFLSSFQSDQNMNNVILTAVVLAIALATTEVRAQVDAAVKDKAQACAACHGATGNSTDPQYPILAGQTAR